MPWSPKWPTSKSLSHRNTLPLKTYAMCADFEDDRTVFKEKEKSRPSCTRRRLNDGHRKTCTLLTLVTICTRSRIETITSLKQSSFNNNPSNQRCYWWPPDLPYESPRHGLSVFQAGASKFMRMLAWNSGTSVEMKLEESA